MTTAVAIQKILKSPLAQQHVAALTEKLIEEAKNRRAFYDWIDESTKAEFINGEIIIHSPVRLEHWKVSDLLASLMSIYVRFKKIGNVGVEKVMISLTRNDYEPDIVYFKKEKAANFTPEQVLFPAPDFIVEILSKKTATINKTIKKDDYAAHGVREYWIIDPKKQIIEQYLLIGENDKIYFQPYIHKLGENITSRVIEGFSIPVQSVFDDAVNIQTLEALLRS